MKSIILITSLIAVLSTSCGGDSKKEKKEIIASDFKNMEFEGEPVFVAMIKLKEPALLSSSERNTEGVYQVDQVLKEKILVEQETMVNTLKSISEDIKVIYSYKMVLNALAVEAPQRLSDEISRVSADFIEADERFAVPTSFQKNQAVKSLELSLAQKNSMSFIGLDQVREKLSVLDSEGQKVPVLGQGVKIGIIDSGIDYTHKMLGGSGDVADYTSIKANSESVHFPNSKVVGGMDFVGEGFNPANNNYRSRIPKPDVNPIDKSGHGTHVAGTAAGLGDGVNTYDGAAPGADLYALKVFGDNEGGTSDTIVIAALEYAVDPNGDLDPSDKLDVVNLSLGGGFGKPHNLYSVAIKNLTKGGVLAVAAAGNSGPVSNIVGAPSTASSALSVAASVDDLPQNIDANGAEFNSENLSALFVEALEGVLTKSLSEITSLEGELYYIGIANVDLTDEQKSALKGKIALIDRGEVAFSDKIMRAVEAGAVGVVMANNQPGEAIVMSGDVSFDIPSVMVTQAVGDQIKKELEANSVVANLKPGKKIQKLELIDSLAPFSSQGPRDLDALIKPEISAPGQAIISASMGSGDQGVMLGGTSMSSPHVAGVAALLIQYRRDLEPQHLKALLMNTSLLISDEQGATYPISRQGAGRIRAFDALNAGVVFSKPSISLGKVAVDSVLEKFESIQVTNFSATEQNYSLQAKNGDNLKISFSNQKISLSPGESTEVQVQMTLSVPSDSETVEEDAFVEILNSGKVVGQIPVLAVINRNSLISPVALSVAASAEAFSPGALVEASFVNESGHDGLVMMFNKIGDDKRKEESSDKSLSFACDLESAGYKVVQKNGVPHLQIATKIYNPVSTWETCDINIELDLNSDGVTDKVVYGSNPVGFPGLANNPQIAELGLSTLIFDAQTLSALIVESQNTGSELDLLPALEAISQMISFNHSTVAVADIPLAGLNVSTLKAKLSVSFNGGDVQERDDALSDIESVWKDIHITGGAAYTGIPEFFVVPAGQVSTASFTKGLDTNGDLIAYFPRNEFNLLREGRGKQSAVMKATFESGESSPSFP